MTSSRTLRRLGALLVWSIAGCALIAVFLGKADPLGAFIVLSPIVWMSHYFIFAPEPDADPTGLIHIIRRINERGTSPPAWSFSLRNPPIHEPGRDLRIRVETLSQNTKRVKWNQKLPRFTWSPFALVAIVLLSGALVGGFVESLPVLGVRRLVGDVIGGVIGVFVFRAIVRIPLFTRLLHEPVLRTIEATAEVAGPVGNDWAFMWNYTMPNGELVFGNIPLSSLKSFELGTYHEWFAPLHSQERLKKFFVLVIQTENGPRCIAAHAGGRAEVAALHAVLTREFIADRPPYSVKHSRVLTAPVEALPSSL